MCDLYVILNLELSVSAPRGAALNFQIHILEARTELKISALQLLDVNRATFSMK